VEQLDQLRVQFPLPVLKLVFMKFVNFLDKIPEEKKTYLCKVRAKDGGWYNKLVTYWGIFKGEHFIETERGYPLDPKDVMYLDEGEVTEYTFVQEAEYV